MTNTPDIDAVVEQLSKCNHMRSAFPEEDYFLAVPSTVERRIIKTIRALEAERDGQRRVSDWLEKIFAKDIPDKPRQRMQRFLEEALEWFQAEDMSKQDAIALVDYVYSRPKGEPTQEVGGVMVTAYAACSRMGYDLSDCFETEFARVNLPHVIDKIRRKQNAQNSVLGISDTTPEEPSHDG